MAPKNPSAKTIIFKCRQHAAIICENLQNFYEQNEFCDTVLISGSNSVSIQAHRVILCALSEYFLEIFRGDQSALNVNKVELKEIEASTLKLIIDFMYSGSVELSAETVEGILRTASFLKIKSLVDGCFKLIEKNIDSSNSLSWFRLGYELNLPTLKTTTLECIYTHFKEISTGEEFLKLSENELKDLLFHEDPHGDVEENVFLAIVEWLNFDKLNRNHLVLPLLSMVCFQALSPKFIIENRKSVCSTVESYELICSWLEWHLSPETRSKNKRICTLKPKKEEKKKKLAAIQTSDNGQIDIKTFDSKINVWSIEKETECPTKTKCTASIVVDGKLIVAGGNHVSIFSKTVECLDLNTSEWVDLPSMKNDRIIWQMADLKGNLCVLGRGINEKEISMEVFNFSTRKWQDVELWPPPSSSVQIATHNEILYLIDISLGNLRYYNVSSNKWTSIEIERQSLHSYSFAAVDGFLYIIGGYNKATQKWIKTVKAYNLSNDSWHEMASLPRDCNSLKITVFENKIITFDCSSYFVDEYCLDTDTWNNCISPVQKHVHLMSQILNICNL